MFNNKGFLIHNIGNENVMFEALTFEIFRQYLKNLYGFDGHIKCYKNQRGLESEPINGVGFQSKFFSHKIDWKQIEESVDIIIKNLDIKSDNCNYIGLKEVIFFLNFELTKSKNEKLITDKLSSYGVKVTFFTDYQKYILSNPMLNDIFFGKYNIDGNRFRFYIDIKTESEIKEHLLNESKDNFKIKVIDTLGHMIYPHINIEEFDLRDLLIHDNGFSLDKNNIIFNYFCINQQKPFNYNEGEIGKNTLDNVDYIKLFHSNFLMSFRKKANISNSLNITKEYRAKKEIELHNFNDNEKILSGIGYDKENKILALRFYSNNCTYHYLDVSVDIYNKIMNTKIYKFEFIKNFKYAQLRPNGAITIKKDDSFLHLFI